MRGLLLFGDTERTAALPVGILDPLLFAEVDGRRYVLTSALEHERVKRALPGAEVLDYSAFGFKDLRGPRARDRGRLRAANPVSLRPHAARNPRGNAR